MPNARITPRATTTSTDIVTLAITRSTATYTTPILLGNTPTPTSHPSHSSLKPPEIGAIVGSILGVFIIVCLFCCYCTTSRQQRHHRGSWSSSRSKTSSRSSDSTVIRWEQRPPETAARSSPLPPVHPAGEPVQIPQVPRQNVQDPNRPPFVMHSGAPPEHPRRRQPASPLWNQPPPQNPDQGPQMQPDHQPPPVELDAQAPRVVIMDPEIIHRPEKKHIHQSKTSTTIPHLRLKAGEEKIVSDIRGRQMWVKKPLPKHKPNRRPKIRPASSRSRAPSNRRHVERVPSPEETDGETSPSSESSESSEAGEGDD